MAHDRAKMPRVASEGSFVTVTVAVMVRMCDVGGSFPRVRVGCCHEHVGEMGMRCSSVLSSRPSPLSATLHLAATVLLPLIIMPSSSSPLSQLLSTIVGKSSSVREDPRGSSIYIHTEVPSDGEDRLFSFCF